MSLRWRGNKLICGAKSEEQLGDTYIDDRMHYMLSQILKVIVPDPDEDTNGLWHWIMDAEGIKEYWRINRTDRLNQYETILTEITERKQFVSGVGWIVKLSRIVEILAG